MGLKKGRNYDLAIMHGHLFIPFFCDPLKMVSKTVTRDNSFDKSEFTLQSLNQKHIKSP